MCLGKLVAQFGAAAPNLPGQGVPPAPGPVHASGIGTVLALMSCPPSNA
jgi:hypothetical protein